MTSPWRIAPSSLRKGLCWDHNPLITPCKDTFRPPRGTKRCESTLNITRFGHQALFFRSLLGLSDSGDKALKPFKFFRFRASEVFGRRESDFLLPPSGDNLVSVLLSRKDIRAAANDLLSPIGLRLGVRPQENKIEVIKEFEDVIVFYPYTVMSDTFQRLIFYLAAILSNKDSVLVFEESESYTFPYYTKYLAEIIALDESNNQYFISTHNPYFLLPLLEKASIADIAVFVTYYEDYQTRVRPLSERQLQQLTEVDIFSNIEAFLEEE